MANPHLWGTVDMGSNGIRFSITDLNPVTARILPALYTDRAGISLYDAQYENGKKVPIPESVIVAVVRALRRFKRTCEDFGVPDANVSVLATEATRVAINSEEYRARVTQATGWQVSLLSKEDEGMVGALGVASSFESVRGLMMDLGGGSTQITWLIAKNGEMRMSDAGSVSMPYGAAALMRRLEEASKAHKVKELRQEITASLKAALERIQVPDELLKDVDTPAGLNLYLSGGGFRGWGYLLMSQHPISPYPIPVINGFKVSVASFHDVDEIKAVAAGDDEVFRVSDRRASQVPAVALLVGILANVLPAIKNVFFAQGGVREGSLFRTFTAEQKAQHPLETATDVFATKSAPAIADVLKSASPTDFSQLRERGLAHRHILQAFAKSMYIHSTLNKDIQAAAALRATTTGALAAVHGADHEERALLALMLCERWGGRDSMSVADQDFQARLVGLLGAENAWWAMYFGKVAAVIAEVYPAGAISGNGAALSVTSSWVDRDALPVSDSEGSQKEEQKDKKDKKGKKQVLVIEIKSDEDTLSSESFLKAVKQLEKFGKKKNRPDKKTENPIKVNVGLI